MVLSQKNATQLWGFGEKGLFFPLQFMPFWRQQRLLTGVICLEATCVHTDKDLLIPLLGSCVVILSIPFTTPYVRGSGYWKRASMRALTSSCLGLAVMVLGRSLGRNEDAYKCD